MSEPTDLPKRLRTKVALMVLELPIAFGSERVLMLEAAEWIEAQQKATSPGSTMDMMAECMDMVRTELIEAGVIDKSVPPMMVADAVCSQLRALETRAVLRGVRIAIEQITPTDFDINAASLTSLQIGVRDSVHALEILERAIKAGHVVVWERTPEECSDHACQRCISGEGDCISEPPGATP